jgi:uncharacterized protein (TIGR04168 family)
MGGSGDPMRVLFVGDVHRVWREADRRFVESGDHDLCVFVGDLGDEDVPTVASIAAIRSPMRVILGNHDAWASFSRRQPTAALREILALLGERHLAYTKHELPAIGMTLVGCRPFSWGGPSMRSAELYQQLFGIQTMEDSAKRIAEVAASADSDDLVLVAHNGPSGLSTQPQDIWGKDFGPPVAPRAGSSEATRAPRDWGDRDLELALDLIRRAGKRVVCVVAGHMHDRLKQPAGVRRTRFVRRGGTVFVNPAVVPRRRRRHGADLGHFVRLTFGEGMVEEIEEIWVDEAGREVKRSIPGVIDLATDGSDGGGDGGQVDGGTAVE